MKSFAEKTAERIERLARLHNIKAVAFPNPKAGDRVEVFVFEKISLADDFYDFLFEEIDNIDNLNRFHYHCSLLDRLLYRILPNTLIKSILMKRYTV